MTKTLKLAGTAIGSIIFVATSLAFGVAAAPASAGEQRATTLLDVRFAPRAVAKVEGGDFHFLPGQPAPIHTHLAPAIGIVVKGTILYQVEGQPLQTLKAGDAFYEPVGPRILRFDNGSETEEAVFIDTNWQRADDPFIHFDKAPTAKIDRRTMTTALAGGATVARVAVKRVDLRPGSAATAPVRAITSYGYVADGAIDLRVANLPMQRVEAGQSFVLPKGAIRVSYSAAKGAPASVVTFEGHAR
ncbi:MULTISPECIES: cupin domain-containing protein [Sphingomonas]|uniref:cupin domain-containing protein n=1 Tax=Sphingomonas TaxID=13687 RepID=UPI00082D489F|nr:cupin domain-containing protein [Sphingomonas sp. CCH10-B3]